MPELPEVENLRRGLEKRIVGQKIKRVVVNKPKLVSGKGNVRIASASKARTFARGLTGETFSAVERRAKNLVFRTKGGKVILAHLKMSGQFIYEPSFAKAMKGKERSKSLVIGGHPIELSEKAALPNKHTHVIFELSDGTLFYNDTRMFGYLLYYPNAAAFEKENHFAAFGPEPLSPQFTLRYLKEKLRSKKGKLKAVLMSQDVVVGLGNIYVDEAAYEAGVRPTRSAASLKEAEVEKLYAAIKRILKRAIKLGGSSVATYRLLDDSQGNYAREHKVYGRAGENCPKCGTPLKKIIVQSRTTVFCPQCQK